MSHIQLADGVAIGRARPDQIPAIRAMQELSLAVLGAGYYDAETISSFIAFAGTMDDAVIDEGHYFVVRNAGGAIIGSGGWSQREPGYDRARTTGAADKPLPGAATVRSVFVHPGVARRGIASALMTHVEQDAARLGIRRMRLMATLSGVAFYARRQWKSEGEKTIALPGGLNFGCVSMTKCIVGKMEKRSAGLQRNPAPEAAPDLPAREMKR